jgi:uncharacterized protein
MDTKKPCLRGTILKSNISFEYPRGVSFICQKCSQCCSDTKDKERNILLLKTDVECISNETFLNINEFAKEISGFEPYRFHMRKIEEGKCFFLKDNRCSIYKIRPLICRFYPFQLQNIGKNKYAFSHTPNCNGIGKGAQLNRSFFENLFITFLKTMEQNNCISTLEF